MWSDSDPCDCERRRHPALVGAVSLAALVALAALVSIALSLHTIASPPA
jgi:hypothetical protein